MTYKYTELKSTLRLFTFILDTLKSTPTVVLVSSYGKSYSFEKHRNKLLFLTLELSIKDSLTFTRASEEFVLVFGCGIMTVNRDRMCGECKGDLITYYVSPVLT